MKTSMPAGSWSDVLAQTGSQLADHAEDDVPGEGAPARESVDQASAVLETLTRSRGLSGR
jgi:hypothetical protein